MDHHHRHHWTIMIKLYKKKHISVINRKTSLQLAEHVSQKMCHIKLLVNNVHNHELNIFQLKFTFYWYYMYLHVHIYIQAGSPIVITKFYMLISNSVSARADNIHILLITGNLLNLKDPEIACTGGLQQ